MKVLNIKFQRNWSNGSWADTCRKTDRQLYIQTEGYD